MEEKGQRITVELGGVKYPLNAPTPERERLIRMAAQEVNRRLEEYNARYAGNPAVKLQDKLAMVSLSMGVALYTATEASQKVNGQIDTLSSELEDYLQKQDNR